MRVSRWSAIGIGLAGALLGATPASASRPAAVVAAVSVAADHHELIYVANDGGPITAYRADSRGSVKPVREIQASGAGFWDPWSLTFDRTGHLYAQSFASEATTYVYRPGAAGAVAPQRIFTVVSPDDIGIAVDSRGFTYVVGNDGALEIVVARPGANGKPANDYFVQPVRTIVLPFGGISWPSQLAVDGKREILVTLGPGSVTVFAGGPHGSSSPIRVIAGPRTDLGAASCATCQAVITYSRLTGLIYVGVSTGTRTHVSEFDANAKGDVRPLRTIQGPATGLDGMWITGIAMSQCDGTIYVLAHASSTGFGSARVFGFRMSARGNARPVRTFTDRRSHLANAQGIALNGCLSGRVR